MGCLTLKLKFFENITRSPDIERRLIWKLYFFSFIYLISSNQYFLYTIYPIYFNTDLTKNFAKSAIIQEY